MNRQSNIPHSDRPKPIDEDKEKPNLDPIRDDPEPLTLPPRETPQKQKMQISEGSYEGIQKYAEGISKDPETPDVEADAKATAPHSAKEAEEMKNAEIEAASHGGKVNVQKSARKADAKDARK